MTIEYTIGADPEMFMADRAGNFKASCGLIGGTKQMPQPMGIGDGFAVQEDNVAIEFNIPPAASAGDLQSYLQRAIKELANGVQTMYQYQIVNVSAASFPKEELEHPSAQVFGCDPDFNAWTKKKNPRPAADDPNLRSCGGHIHVGYDRKTLGCSPLQLVKAMDLFLGVPSVVMDTGELRKQLYGKAGAFRLKPYGVEYRTLSNFWIFNEKLIEWVWNNTGKALNAAGLQLVDFDQEQEAIRTAIDRNDKLAAMKLIERYKLEVLNV
jgi:hypothetical protein